MLTFTENFANKEIAYIYLATVCAFGLKVFDSNICKYLLQINLLFNS